MQLGEFYYTLNKKGTELRVLGTHSDQYSLALDSRVQGSDYFKQHFAIK